MDEITTNKAIEPAESDTVRSVTTVVFKEIDSDEKFRPTGAIAFFVLLLLICAAIWYSIYYIALTRQ